MHDKPIEIPNCCKHALTCTALLLPLLLSKLAFGQQATLDGNIVNLPIVVFGDRFYEVQLGLIPLSNPPELELVGGWELFNKESEVEYKSGVNGIWTITEDVNSEACGVDPYTDSYDVDVIRDGDDLTVTAGEGIFSGSISGNTLNWSGSFDEEDGSLTTSASVVFSPDQNSITGSSSWQLSVDDESCSGTSIISGELTVPEETPYAEISTEDSVMPFIFNSVDEGASVLDGAILTIPSINVDGLNFWVELELIDPVAIEFKLADAGLSDVQMGLLWDENNEEFNGAVFYSEGAGRVELSFNPVTGLLHDVLINDDYFVFANYTNTTVDIFKVEPEGVTVIPDVPLTDGGRTYVEEMTSSQGNLPFAALSLNPGASGGFSAAAATLEVQDKQNDLKAKAADRSQKGLDFAAGVFVDAIDSGFSVPKIVGKITIEIAKGYGHKFIDDNVSKETADKIQVVIDAREAMDIRNKCLTVRPSFSWALACKKYWGNKEKIDEDIQRGVDLGLDIIEILQQEKTRQRELQLGLLEDKASPVLDTDRDNNNVPDSEQDSLSYDLGPFHAYTTRVLEQQNLLGEKVGSCPFIDVKSDIFSNRLDDDVESWWWGCVNAAGNNMGTWTYYDADFGAIRTQTYFDGVLHGPYYNEHSPYGGGFWESGQYANGDKDGTWTAYEQNVATSIVTYKDGVADGPFLERGVDDNDTKTTGQYVNGKRDGEWLTYIEGKFDTLVTYLDGAQSGPFESYRPNGYRDSGRVGTLFMGITVGVWKFYEFHKLTVTITYDATGGVVDVKYPDD